LLHPLVLGSKSARVLEEGVMTVALPNAQLLLGYMRDWVYYKNTVKYENSPIGGCPGDRRQPVFKYANR